MNDAAFTILTLFLVMAVIVSAVTTATGRRAVEAERARGDLADEQAAMRRLALLIAQGVAPDVVFGAVTKEVLQHLGGGTARLIRFEPDGTATLLANEGTSGPHVVAGGRWEGYPPRGLTAAIQQTGKPSRVDDYHDVPGGAMFLNEGLLSAVGVPIHVSGRLWGMIAVGSESRRLPVDSESRMAQFTELVATAVAAAQSRAELINSRARIIAAADEARRRIERDLHDGAQQRLVALALRLRTTGIDQQAAATDLLEVIDELRELSRGRLAMPSRSRTSSSARTTLKPSILIPRVKTVTG
ncbi:GAF domain-containing protein [Actinoplanes sp. NPDC020271]|uniref:sensor histidine kinase n=1 Tax=Actinoplanes sp. NPDC020271 TaxID=3363896 RepID=UPI00379A3D5C